MNDNRTSLYLALRQLEQELARPGSLEILRDTAGNALSFTMEISRIVDAFEGKTN